MCGRYYIEIGEDEMRDIIRTVSNNVHATEMKTGEIFPTNIVPIKTGDNRVSLMKWGFTRYDGKGQIINARSETALEKPMFRKPLLERRCLVPASYYFEWEKDGTKKVKHKLYTQNAPVVYMAGIYRMEKSSELPVFVILTKEAAPVIRHIHDRMPVIIPNGLASNWMKGELDVMAKSVDDVAFSIA